MAYLDDDFQGYAIGASAPFGSWLVSPGSFALPGIVAGGSIIPGTDRHLDSGLGGLVYNGAGYLSSFSIYAGLFLAGQPAFSQTSFVCANGPNLGGFTFNIFSLAVEADSTITMRDGLNVLLGNSKDQFFPFFQWNFIQVSVTLSKITVSGVDYVHIFANVFVNGQLALNVDKTTGIDVSNLANPGFAQVNQFTIGGGQFAAYTLDTYSAAVNYPHPGSPKALAYQGPIEINILPSNGKLRVHQAPIEIDILPSTTKLRVFQCVIEVDITEAQGFRGDYIHRRHYPGD